MRLVCEKNSVLVSPQGGSIYGWWNEANQILGTPRPVLIEGEVKWRMENHWCFPQFGSVPEGAPIELPKHGFFRNLVLNEDRMVDDMARFSTLEVSDGCYLDLGAETRVYADGVGTCLSVRNKDKEPFPVLPAYHPYFMTPSCGLVVLMDGKEIAQVHPRKVLNVSDTAQIVELTGEVSVLLLGIGEVKLKLSERGSHIAIWSDSPNQYVCVEPIFGTPGTFGLPNGYFLKKDEKYFCEVGFTFKSE